MSRTVDVSRSLVLPDLSALLAVVYHPQPYRALGILSQSQSTKRWQCSTPTAFRKTAS